MHICFVQSAHGFGSSMGSGNTVLFAPQKHLQKKTGFAAWTETYIDELIDRPTFIMVKINMKLALPGAMSL